MKVRKFKNARKALVGLIVTAVALMAIALVAGSGDDGHGHGHGHGHGYGHGWQGWQWQWNPPPPPIIPPVVFPNYTTTMDSYDKNISNIDVDVDSSNMLLVDTSGSSYYGGGSCWTCGCCGGGSGPLFGLGLDVLQNSNVDVGIFVNQVS